MNKMAKLLLTALIFTSWAKAGLGYEWNLWMIDLVVLFVALSLIGSRSGKSRSFALSLAPILVFGFYIFLSFLNPRYVTLDVKEWNEINADKYFSEETNFEKIGMLSNGFRNINAVREKDPQLALTLFFDLKNRYFDRFDGTDSPSANLLNAYEEKIGRKPIEFLPSIPLRNSPSIHASIHFLFQLTFGIVTFFALRTRNEIRNFVWVIGVNGGLLALIGIIQKVHYVPSDSLKEIFGIWDAPEPRYFYSSFTYKNHWCAFALLSLFAVIALLYYQFKHATKKIIHSKSILFLATISVCLLISIPHSGSRSGFAILVFVLACFVYKFLVGSKISGRKFNWSLVATSAAALSAIIAFSFYINRDTTKEMLTNTNTQFTDVSNQQLPLRILLWTDLVNQINAETLWGSGFDSYPAINPIHQSKEVRERRSIGLENAHNPYTPLIGHGHSDFLEFISEFGIPFFMLLIFFPILATAGIIHNPSPFPKIILLGCLAFLLYFLVDFPTRSPACLLLFSSTLGFSFRYAQLTNSRHNSKN
ncbi:MAG: O-antigen ligase family protein [Opitutae bacterium]|jgi:hypothetical protein|nr:O-antigen ligase family protein [Opitutae bacterium]